MSPSNPTKNNNTSSTEHKPLRQIAAEKLHGPNANPSQLGDPISLKAETTPSKFPASGRENNEPGPANPSLPEKTRTPPPSSGGSHEEKMLRGEGPKGHFVRGMMTEDIKRGKVGKPSKTLEGDATSLKAETTERDPVDHDNGVPGRGSASGRDSKSKL